MICPLCLGPATDLTEHQVSGGPDGALVEVCPACVAQIGSPTNPDHFRSLATSMWSEEPAMQVLAARVLASLNTPWADDLSEQQYLDDETRAWADNIAKKTLHKDAHGAALATGDTVVLIKDLPVKGAGFIAKRGTPVRNIALVPDTPEHIEGRVEGQRIVILTEFVRRKG